MRPEGEILEKTYHTILGILLKIILFLPLFTISCFIISLGLIPLALGWFLRDSLRGVSIANDMVAFGKELISAVIDLMESYNCEADRSMSPEFTAENRENFRIRENGDNLQGSLPSPANSINNPETLNIATGPSNTRFTYEELVMATNNFSDDNLLGEGGFAYVYKGTLPNGKQVAVKLLKATSKQEELGLQEEVEILSHVHHRHLVSLIGSCTSQGKLLMVCEYMPNNTLEFHLHGRDQPTLNWQNRFRIALDSARGLAYLHEDCQPRVIHRDIKAANILLDNYFRAKIADFGIAKHFSDEKTHISTLVKGTYGYLAPEYAATGQLTDKSDVFSFGVVLLELITGRRPAGLADWARPLLNGAVESGYCVALVDLHLENNYNPVEMGRMVACAAACLCHSALLRPSMSEIIRALEGFLSVGAYTEDVQPGYVISEYTPSSSGAM